MITIDFPSFFIWYINWYIACFTPISTPRVGQSRINTSLPRPIHFPNTTFCLFPPDNAETYWFIPAHLILNVSTCFWTYFFSFHGKIRNPPVVNWSSPPTAILSLMLAFRHSDSVSLSFATYPTICFIASASFFNFFPLILISPDSGFLFPNMTFPSVCIPQCESPPIPRISPLCNCRLKSISLPVRFTSFISKTTSSSQLPS